MSQNKLTKFENSFRLADMSLFGVDKPHRFYEVNMYDALLLIDSDDFDGILFFGFSSCPWCQSAIGVLNQASLDTDTDIYYINRAPELRNEDWLALDTQMARWLDEHIEMELNVEKIEPHIYVPQIVHLKDRKIINSYRGIAPDHNAMYTGMSDELKNSLYNKYVEIFKASD